MEKFKKWLTDNKIWFETITATLLSVASIFVSCATYNATSKQAEVGQLQAEVTKMQNSPIFNARAKLEKDPPESEVYNKDTLVVTNNGAMVREISLDSVVFLKVEHGTLLDKQETIIPLNGFYGAQISTGENKNELFYLFNGHIKEGNNSRLFTLSNQFRKQFQEDSHHYSNIDLQRYIRLSYIDLFEEKHVEYHSVDTFGNHKITTEEGEIIFNDTSKKIQDGLQVEFGELDINLLNDYLHKHASKQK